MFQQPSLPQERGNTPSFHPQYRPDIDGLRALAVLAVVIFHAFPLALPGGFIGVDVFFVISGFLITLILLENLARGQFSLSGFYRRRILRIFPALTIVLLATLLAGWFMLLDDEYRQLGKHTLAGAGFALNFVLRSEAGYFDTSSEAKPLLHLWSLGIEEQFYLGWPLIVWLTWRRKALFPWVCLTLLALSFGNNILRVQGNAVATFFNPLSRAWELLTGAMLAYAQTRVATGKPLGNGGILPGMAGPLAANLLSLLALAALFAGCLLVRPGQHFPGWQALVPVAGTALLIATGPSAWVNRKLLATPLLVWFGLISYALYLWHWPLLSFSWLYGGQAPEPAIRLALVALAIGLAWLTTRHVEWPIRRAAAARRNSLRLLAGMMATALVGGLVLWRQGFPARLGQPSLADQKLDHRFCLAAVRKQGYCEFGTPTAGKALLLYGDSYAFHLAKALEQAAGGRYRMFLVWSPTCFFGMALRPPGHAEETCDARRRLLGELKLPPLQATIHAQFWRAYGLDSVPAIRSAITDALMDFRLKPARTVIVGPTPNINLRCGLALHYPGVAPKSASCMDNLDIENHDYQARFASALAELPLPPGARWVYPMKTLCPGQPSHCTLIEHDKVYYHDNSHLTEAGAARIMPELLQAIEGP